MTKEESKADELIKKFSRPLNLLNSSENRSVEGYAKDCAIIAIEEILKSDPLSPSKFDQNTDKETAYKKCESDAYEFWQKVKSILLKRK